MQSDANQSLHPNSLLAGKRTGNSVKIKLVLRFKHRIHQQSQLLAGKFPTGRSREFLLKEQGI
jgi:hypothetical protein